LCVLLLRGPQTPGELRGRTERMHNNLRRSATCLADSRKLMERDPPLVAVLARQPGTKESRYAHLLSGEGSVPMASAAALHQHRPRMRTALLNWNPTLPN